MVAKALKKIFAQPGWSKPSMPNYFMASSPSSLVFESHTGNIFSDIDSDSVLADLWMDGKNSYIMIRETHVLSKAEEKAIWFKNQGKNPYEKW